MKTLPEIITWLSSPDHIRIILVEVAGVKVQGSPTTLYLSNKPFTSTSTDTPASTCYEPCLVGGISFTESLSLDGSASIGYGDLEISNYSNGERDTWLKYIWANRNIDIYIGDPRWPKNDFYKIFTGVVSDIASRDSSTLNLLILDKLEKLNKPISETLLGGTGTNKDAVKPLLFGECFNIEPLYTSDVPSTLTYMVHNGPIEGIIEVRDNGVPLLGDSLPTVNNTTGVVTLVKSPAGQITMSVQGAKASATNTYTNNIADIIKHIVKNYGNTISDADIDLTNFSNFASANIQPVGVYCKDKENILDICQQLANSVGASICFTSLGKLKLIRLALPGTGTTYYVTPEDMEYNSFSASDKPTVISTTKINYCKNWTAQTSGLATGIPTTHIPVFSKDWHDKPYENITTTSEYVLTNQVDPIDTLLLVESDALAEATRRTNLWSTCRYIYTATYYAHLLPVEIGDTLNIIHPRYSMNGAIGLVVEISRDWVSGRITIGVLV